MKAKAADRWLARQVLRVFFIQNHRQHKRILLCCFNKFYPLYSSYCPKLEGLIFNKISRETKAGLEQSFRTEEVVTALHSLKEDKAPGPNGFPSRFYVEFWDTIGTDVMEVMREFHESASWCRSLIASFISLIPKKAGVEEIKDYRPISVVGKMYKLLAKVLSNRLVEVLGEVISENQCAFIRGRKIVDCSLIANELVDTMRKKRRSRVMCQLDMEKAYDHINWGFLDSVMRRMGFGRKWRNRMQVCISSPSFSILLNGASESFFKSSRGLRKGDPLTPFLFILVMEGLSKLILKAEHVGMVEAWEVSHDGLRISILQFAEDTLLFMKVDVEQVQVIRCLLLLFEVASGLKVNLSKSTIIGVGNFHHLGETAGILSCQVGILPRTYLGLPPLLGPNTKVQKFGIM